MTFPERSRFSVAVAVAHRGGAHESTCLLFTAAFEGVWKLSVLPFALI
jgi:hypothetical protein